MRLLWFNLRMMRENPITAFAIDWVNEVAKLVDHIDVVTMMAGTYRVQDNVSVYSIGKEKGYSEPRRVVEFYSILGQLLTKQRHDACFAHMMPVFAVMGVPLLKMRRIPITLWYAHKSVTNKLRVAEKLVDRVVTASLESFRIPSHKVIVTGHGIDTAKFVPASTPRPPNQLFTVLSVGRIAPIKRLEILIDAARLLVKEHNLQNIRVRLVGNIYPHDALYSKLLHQQAKEYDLGNTVQFAGPVPFEEVVKEYQQADVMVNLSDTDSVDKTVLEAMSCQVPVITSNGAFGPILKRWADLLQVPKHSPVDLALRLRNLALQHPWKRQSLGEELRRIVVEQHSLENLSKRLVSEIL